MIVRRFLSIFYPPAEYQTVKLVVAAGGEKLYTSAKQLKVPGYLEIAGVPKTAKERNAAKTDGEEQTQGSDAEAAREEEENAGLLAYAGRLQRERYFLRMAMPSARERPPRRSATRLDRWCSPWRMPDSSSRRKN